MRCHGVFLLSLCICQRQLMRIKTKKESPSKAISAREDGVVTLEMVAQLAKVSPSTVSRILNGTAIVSEDKKQAVAKAVAALGFVPNPVARGLAGGRTLSIGVITQAIDSPFYGSALRGIEDALDPRGYSPLFVSGHWNESAESRCLEVLRSRRVDGVIVLTGRLPDQTLTNFAKTTPTVVTGRELKAQGLYSLSFDNFEGGRLATQHLIDQGHRQIAYISGDPEHPDATERMRGYRFALEQADIAYNSGLVVQGEYNELSGLRAVDHLFEDRQHFTAIFAGNDQMAFGAALGLKRHGLRVPDDVSLIGFDDLPSSVYANPPLTTIHHPAYELGCLAATAILELLAGKLPSMVIPAPRLISRESSRRFSNYGN
jgi:LacI family transcriptional regulator